MPCGCSGVAVMASSLAGEAKTAVSAAGVSSWWRPGTPTVPVWVGIRSQFYVNSCIRCYRSLCLSDSR